MAQDLVLTTISNLKSLYDDERRLFEFVNEEMENLQSNLSAIEAVLQDAEKQQLAGTSETLNDWLRKLKDAVHELDGILDDCTTEAIRDEYKGGKSCAFLGLLHPQKFKFRHDISGRMKAIKKRLDRIAEDKNRYLLLTAETQADTSRETTHHIDTEYPIIGREQEKEHIICYLLEDASNADTLSVYPIVGMGGLGKTTLAQLVYNDEKVAKHFEPRKWVCVSENFDLATLVKAITESNRGSNRLEPLVEELQGMLRGKRYLIIFDDVWNDQHRDRWMQLRSYLSCGAKGSAILVTTRLETVATIMGTSTKPCRLGCLSDPDCWKILSTHAFGGIRRGVETKDLTNIDRIGQEIAKKCNGLPLAAKTLGSLLRGKTDEKFWRSVLESDLWNLPEGKDSIFAALRLSYLNLQPRSRRCFSFCAIYPKDYEIKKEELVHLWMANGFISKEADRNLEMEDVGEEIINDLYQRSLIQDVERDEDESGRIVSFQMHDLVHDLAQSIVRQEICALEESNFENMEPRTRHVFVDCEFDSTSAWDALKSCKSLQCLLFSPWRDSLPIWSSLRRHTTLKALDWPRLNVFESEALPELPPSIHILKNLRYLNLSGSRIRKLPESIGSLWNLQTLILNGCGDLEALPMSMGRLKNLRHLPTDDCISLLSIPQSMSALTSLRTLTPVVVGEPRKNEFQLSGLKHMSHLNGKLEILHLEKATHMVKDAEEANLKDKRNVRNLSLRWDLWTDSDDGLWETYCQLLEALRPPSRLRRLELEWYPARSFADWMLKEFASFTCLQSLSLSFCYYCTQLPPWWRLPNLKRLDLWGLREVRYLIDADADCCREEFIAFQSLEVIGLEDLSSLEKMMSREEAEQEMNDDVRNFRRLSELSITGCPKLNSFFSCPLPSLRSLRLRRCEKVVLSMFTSTSTSYNLQDLNSSEFSTSDCKSLIDNIPPSLNSVEDLDIFGCESLESFPQQMLQGLSSLRKLSIRYCEKLKILPEGFKSVPSLKDLDISRCPQVADISSIILQSASLRSLRLHGLEILDVTIPESLTVLLPALKVLKLEDCPNLASLPNWMAHLLSLEELRIQNCPGLTSLPDSIQQLSKLNGLTIRGCPELEKRCEKEIGQDWHKIAHIPHINLRGRYVRR